MLNYVKRLLHSRSNKAFIKHLKSKGIKVGENCEFFGRLFIDFDFTRPSLIEIGDNVVMAKGVTLLTHGYDWCVLRQLYGQSFGYAKSVKIGNNVFIGQHVRILPGVTIGDNCIIGVGSIVTKVLPSNGVYAGNPARFICSVDDYYKNRVAAQLIEATEYAQSIIERYNRMPKEDDFKEFFELFLERDETKFGNIPVRHQTADKYYEFMKSTPVFNGFEEFLKYVLKKIYE